LGSKDPKANPVTAWANVVHHVCATARCKEATKVFHFGPAPGKVNIVDSNLMLVQLRAAVAHLGESALGYSPADIGTHLIRSGAAMVLVLSDHAAWRTMLAGQWKLSAFLVYIREQVQAFSRGVSDRMIENPDFFHVPDLNRLNNTTSSTPTTPALPLEANVFNGGASNNYQVLNMDFFGKQPQEAFLPRQMTTQHTTTESDGDKINLVDCRLIPKISPPNKTL
jgi:hypothetical protein